MQNINESVDDIISRCRDKSKQDEGNVVYLGEREEKKSPPLMVRYGLSKKHHTQTFESFQGNEKIVAALREVTDESIVLTGQTGSGKTHLAVALMKESKEIVQYFVTVPELLLEIRMTYHPDSRENEEDIIRKYSQCPLLVLDDLGSEKSSEFSINTLYLILDRRNREMKKTIITTNLSLDEIEQSLGARIASRLSEMKIIKINMPDFRKKRR